MDGVAVNANRTIGMPAKSESRAFVRTKPSYIRRCFLAAYVDKKVLVDLDTANLDSERRVSCWHGRHYDVELVQPDIRGRQPLVRDGGRRLSKQEGRFVGREGRSLGGDGAGARGRRHGSKSDSVDRQGVTRLGRMRRHSGER